MGENKNVSEGANSKLEWMYKGPNNNVDQEDYLLGKAVTNTTAIQGIKNEVERDCLPSSLFSTGTSGTGSAIVDQVDVARKLHEDPLLAIRKKEIERREQLLKNPVKLKKLHDMLKRQREQAKEKTVKKKNKKKKRKSISCSDEGDDDIDKELKKKYKKLKSKLKLNDIFNLSDDEDCKGGKYSDRKSKRSKKNEKDWSESDTSHDDNYKIRNSRELKKKGEKLRYSNEKSFNSSERNFNRKSKNYNYKNDAVDDNSDSDGKYNKNKRKFSASNESNKYKKEGNHCPKSHSSRSRTHSKHKSKLKHDVSESEDSSSSSSLSSPESEDSSRMKKKFGLVLPAGKDKESYSKQKQDSKVHDKERNDSVEKKKNANDRQSFVKPQLLKLTEAEKELKRSEMMKNAEWRNELRSKNIKSYKEKEEKEKKLEKDYSSEFYRKQLSYAASQGSVEGRIKSNINRIQRSASDMDKNFARR